MAIDFMRYFPSAEGEEIVFLKNLTALFDDEQITSFSTAYNARRRKPGDTLLYTFSFILGLSGGHRFYLGQTGMGVLYLLTYGLCGIGNLIDIFRSKSLTYARNIEIANDVALQLNLSQGSLRENHSEAEAKTQGAPDATPVLQPAQREMFACGITGNYAGQLLPIGQAPLMIGRDASLCSVILSSGAVSRRHAKVTLGGMPDSVILEDLGSTNGTFIQSNSVWVKITTPVTLTIFKRFRIGDAENEFEIR